MIGEIRLMFFFITKGYKMELVCSVKSGIRENTKEAHCKAEFQLTIGLQVQSNLQKFTSIVLSGRIP